MAGKSLASLSMVAKLGFILLVLCFGLAMFLAGVLAPEAWRQPLAAGTARLGPAVEKPAAGAPSPAAAPPAAAATDTPTPVPHESVLLKEPRPAGAEYGIQLGLFADAAAAEPLGRRVQGLGYAPESIVVNDSTGARWILLLAGTFPSPEEAEPARAALRQSLGGSLPLPVVIRPPKPPKGEQGSN